MARKLSAITQKNLIKEILVGSKTTQIMKKLRISKSSIQRMRNNLKKRTLTGTKKVPGRKPILTEKKINLLGKTALKNSFDSSFTIFEKSNVLKNKTPSKTTCRKYLRAAGFKNHLAARKPHLTEFHARERLRVAQFIIDQPDSYIESLMPSDECKFNIAGNDGRVRIWREPNTRYDKHNILTTQKFGGGKSVMVWAVMSVHGLGNCVLYQKVWIHKHI